MKKFTIKEALEEGRKVVDAAGKKLADDVDRAIFECIQDPKE